METVADLKVGYLYQVQQRDSSDLEVIGLTTSKTLTSAWRHESLVDLKTERKIDEYLLNMHLENLRVELPFALLEGFDVP